MALYRRIISYSKRIISLFLVAAVLFSVIIFPDDLSSAEDDGYGLKNPKMVYKTKECVYFGNYWQTDTNNDGSADKKDDKTPIKWIVLSREGDDLFLMADRCLDAIFYDCRKGDETKDTEDLSWANSRLRGWLNSQFYNNAFSEKEQAAIKVTKVFYNHNFIYTSDKVYIPPSRELENEKYDIDRFMLQAKATAYADEIVPSNYKQDGYLREEGYRKWQFGKFDSSDFIDYIDGTGGEQSSIYFYTYGWYFIRPMLHVDLSLVTGSEEDDNLLADAGTTETGMEDITYDCIYFGNYRQKDTNGDGEADDKDEKTPVKWRVLSVNGDDAFIMADTCLDYMKYNNMHADVTWETSDIRKWLNGDFYDNLCDENEKKAVKDTYVNNSDTTEVEHKSAKDTTDKIYLPSFGDLVNDNYGFPKRSYLATVLRRAKSTDYAYEKYSMSEDVKYERNPWFIREITNSETCMCANDNGILTWQYTVGDATCFIRPVMHIDLSQDVWTKAGSVCVSDSEDSEYVSSLPATAPSAQPTPTMIPTDTPAPTDTPKPTHNPATQPPDEQAKPWPDGAQYYELDLTTSGYIGGNSRYVENSDGSITLIFKGKYPDMGFVVDREHLIKDYYRWVEIVYSDSDGYRGVSVYDKHIDYDEPWNSGEYTKYDLGDDRLPEYAGECRVVIDTAELTEWDDYLTQIDIYAPTYGDGESDGGRITLKSIRLYSDTTAPPPTATPRPTVVPGMQRPTVNPSTQSPAKAPVPTQKRSVTPKPAVTVTPSVMETMDPTGNNPAYTPAAKPTPEKPKKLLKPKFTARKSKQGKINYIEIKLKKYEGEYIQVYVKDSDKKYRRVLFGNIKIKKYKGVFKVQYLSEDRKLSIKVRTYSVKKKKKIYSPYSKVKKIVT